MESEKIIMCNSAVHRPFNTIVEPFPFTTFQFLRTCNRLVLPTDTRQYYTVLKDTKPYDDPTLGPETIQSKRLSSPVPAQKSTVDISPNPDSTTIFPPSSSSSYAKDISSPPTLPPPPIITGNAPACLPPENFDYISDFNSVGSGGGGGHTHLPSMSYSNLFSRRQRGEKRPIPEEQKDEKYFERRKRNNEAAKKSRDARKLREDRIAFRAAILEHENAILRAQLLALRDEMTTLRQMMGSRATQISLNL